MNEIDTNVLTKMDVFVNIGIPIITTTVGGIIGYFAALIPYKKKFVIDFDLEHMQFKVYNTGNAAVVIKTIGISRRSFYRKNRKKILYQQSVDMTLQPGATPLAIDIPIEKFILDIESAINVGTYPPVFNCFLFDPNGKYYNTKCTLDLWAHHERYFGRDPNAANENDLPF